MSKRLFGQDLEDKFEELNVNKDKPVNESVEESSMRIPGTFHVDFKRLAEKFNNEADYRKVMWNREDHHQVAPFDQMMRTIKNRGWDRLPTPQEMLTLLYAYEEGIIHSDLEETAEAVKFANEMTCYAVHFEAPTLFLYENVQGMKYKPVRMLLKMKKYFPPKGQFYRKYKTILLTGVDHGDKIPLDVFNQNNSGVVEYLYGRKFDDIPDKVKDEMPQIHFPRNKNLYMIVKEGRNTPYDLNLGGIIAYGKGVKER